jgi:hypothetical protein
MEVEQALLEFERVQEGARRVRDEERFSGIEVDQAQVGRLDDPELRLRRRCRQQTERGSANDDRGPSAGERQRSGCYRKCGGEENRRPRWIAGSDVVQAFTPAVLADLKVRTTAECKPR